MSPEQTFGRARARRAVALKRGAAAAAGWLMGTWKARPLAGFGLQAKAMEKSDADFLAPRKKAREKN